MSCTSASVGFWPNERMTVPSSRVLIVPSPSPPRPAGVFAETDFTFKLSFVLTAEFTATNDVLDVSLCHLLLQLPDQNPADGGVQ